MIQAVGTQRLADEHDRAQRPVRGGPVVLFRTVTSRPCCCTGQRWNNRRRRSSPTIPREAMRMISAYGGKLTVELVPAARCRDSRADPHERPPPVVQRGDSFLGLLTGPAGRPAPGHGPGHDKAPLSETAGPSPKWELWRWRESNPRPTVQKQGFSVCSSLRFSRPRNHAHKSPTGPSHGLISSKTP